MVLGINQTSLNQIEMVGHWSIDFFDDDPYPTTISSNGTVSIIFHGNSRSSHLVPSDDDIHFPHSLGWYKVNDLVYDNSWDYVRVQENGSLEVQHFCNVTFHSCAETYGNLTNYCCVGLGTWVPPPSGK